MIELGPAGRAGTRTGWHRWGDPDGTRSGSSPARLPGTAELPPAYRFGELAPVAAKPILALGALHRTTQSVT